MTWGAPRATGTRFDVQQDDDREDGSGGAGAGAQRLDKWLWFARVLKSRTQAAALVSDGKVRINRVRALKPSQSVRSGDVLTISVRGDVRVLKVELPGVRRGPPAEARTLYEDLTPVAPEPARPVAERASGTGRPTKLERRLVDRLKRRQ